MQPDPADLARGWLAAAEQDLDVAREIAARFPNVACFHAQQAGEKALKALIVRAAGDVVHTHRSDALLAEAANLRIALAADVVDAIDSLEKYYLPTRYPDALGTSSPARAYKEDDARLALRQAERVVNCARRALDDQET